MDDGKTCGRLKKRTMVSACACVHFARDAWRGASARVLGPSWYSGQCASARRTDRDIGVRSEEKAWWVGLRDVVVECLWEGVYWSGVVPASRVGGARFKSEKQDPKKYGDWDSDVGDDERTD